MREGETKSESARESEGERDRGEKREEANQKTDEKAKLHDMNARNQTSCHDTVCHIASGLALSTITTLPCQSS